MEGTAGNLKASLQKDQLKQNFQALFSRTSKKFTSVGTQTDSKSSPGVSSCGVLAKQSGNDTNPKKLASLLKAHNSQLEILKKKENKSEQELKTTSLIEAHVADLKERLLRWAIDSVPEVIIPQSERAASDFMISKFMVLNSTAAVNDKRLERKIKELETAKKELDQLKSDLDSLSTTVELENQEMKTSHEKLVADYALLRQTREHEKKRLEGFIKENQELRKLTRMKDRIVERRECGSKKDKAEIARLTRCYKLSCKRAATLTDSLERLKSSQCVAKSKNKPQTGLTKQS